MTQAEALTILKTGANVFLTGEPGAGKSYTINEYVRYLRSHDIEPAITASTGIAATHINGMTIHSWSGIGIHKDLDHHYIKLLAKTRYIAKRIKETNVLIIDEVSMLSPTTLNLVEAVCREGKQNTKPFGGMQVIFVGDFFQLPPIVKKREEEGQEVIVYDKPEAKFAYDSSAWLKAEPEVCYLTEQHRQDDPEFLSVLSAIRGNTFGMTHVNHVESRRTTYEEVPEEAPKLFSHNMDVDLVNNDMLSQLPGEVKEFKMRSQGPSALIRTLAKGCLSPEVLNLKIGAAVMFTKNNHLKGFVNGTLGIVEGFRDTDGAPIVKTRQGRKIEAEPMDWGLEENGQPKATITQIPLRLAWAITVHKSQGMSLDEAVMDLSEVFEYGQGYVALSRVRRLSGVHLIGWNQRAFQVHPDIFSKDKEFRAISETAEKNISKISQKRHKDFIVACGGSPEEIQKEARSLLIMPSQKADTHKETLKLWKEGNTIAEIASARSIKERTVFDHIEELVKTGQIARTEISRLMRPALTKDISGIHGAFKELDTQKLTPVFEKFQGAYSYEDLRLARMLIEE